MTQDRRTAPLATGEAGHPTFADLIAPLSPEEFFAEYHGRKVLHVPGTADKFAFVMSWAKLTELLNMTALWTSRSLEMALDGTLVPAREYCRPGLDHGSGAAALQPEARRVTALLKKGASLLLNDIDTFSPGLAAVAHALEEALESRVQANLYCSSRERQAFPSHFDTHDVYALHMEGEKLWRIYEGRLENPIPHPAFQGQPASFHEQARGKPAMDILLKPGDLLYIPRGTYHDAVAQSDATLHIAFGATAVIGLDFVSSLFERAVHEPLFRADVPRRHAPGGEAAFDRHMKALAEKLAALASDPAMIARFRAFQDDYRYPRGGFDLPRMMRSSGTYRVTSDDFAVVRHGDMWVLRRGGKGTAIPAGLDRPVAWIVTRTMFDDDELATAFPQVAAAERAELLRSLEAMGVIAAVR